MTTLAAILWDVDGTLAETERDGHRVAFNLAFEASGLPWRWDVARYGELLRIVGGRERLLHDMNGRSDAPPQSAARAALARELHAKKNLLYEELISAGGIDLRGGVQHLLDECREQGVRLAIATTTSRSNVAALLQHNLGKDWRARFAAVVCGDDVQRKKPDPEVFHDALHELGVAARESLAIEDSPAGVAAASAAGCPVLITRSSYFEATAAANAIATGPGLHTREGWSPAVARASPPTHVGLADIMGWWQAATR